MSKPSIVRPLAVLSTATFVSIATMRVADPLLPQVAQEFDVTVGDASIVATAFALAYGIFQLFYGAFGDRFGKYRLVVLATLVSALTVLPAAFADSIGALGLARFASGATAAAIVPLSFAFIGDHVPYRDRQTVLARFLTGTILGVIAGQVFGGVIGDLIGWRAVFLLLSALFLLVGILLAFELRSARVPPPILTRSISPASFLWGYALLFRRPWVRVVLAVVFIESFLFWGGFTFIGAFLRSRFELDYTIVGLFLGFMGLGGILYALSVRHLVRRLAERGLSLWGGALIALGFLAVALGPLPAMAPAIVLLGLGLYMLHNTLQTNATQMAPETRGLAVSTFASALFYGQASGVWLCGLAVDRIGYRPVFIVLGAALLACGVVFALLLARRPVTD
jgi:predicted MFS family arabinose efflux permease